MQVPQDQPVKTSHTLRPLCPEMNLILCPNNNVSSLWYPKSGTEPYPKTRTYVLTLKPAWISNPEIIP